jgi:hypothetical protein
LDFVRIVVALLAGFGALAIARRFIDPPGQRRTSFIVNAIGAAVALLVYFVIIPAIWR